MHSIFRRCAATLLLATGLQAQAADVTVSAAISLTQAFRDLAPIFEAAHPGAKLRLNFAASGALLQQIAQGAPVDVFVSADPETMDQAQRLVPTEQRRNVASNALVVIVPVARSNPPRVLADLTQSGYARIAIGLPASVPVGRYTKAALEATRLWNSIAPKMVGAHNARQALDYVARAEVDAGFVYATDAALMADKVQVAFAVASARPILYPAAVLLQGPNAALGRRFVDFLLTAPAQAVLARHGFGAP